MTKLRILLLSVALSFSVVWTPASATPFTGLYIFGDSLTDTGNIFNATGGLPLAPYAPGRISNGPVWAEQMADNLGLGSVIPSALGGNNYAFAGALTAVDGDIFVQGAGDLPSLTSQLNAYLMGNSPDPDALYVIWGGGNNIRSNTSANSASDLAGMVSALAAQGATNFLVPNLPDIGKTPESLLGAAPACAADPDNCSTFMSGLTVAHNNALATELGLLGLLDPLLNIQLFDVYSIFNDLIANPGMFGFTTTDMPCYTGPAFGTGMACDFPDEYVFWDGIHPTAAAHRLLGDLASAQVVPVPAAVWLFGTALFGLVGLRRRNA